MASYFRFTDLPRHIQYRLLVEAKAYYTPEGSKEPYYLSADVAATMPANEFRQLECEVSQSLMIGDVNDTVFTSHNPALELIDREYLTSNYGKPKPIKDFTMKYDVAVHVGIDCFNALMATEQAGIVLGVPNLAELITACSAVIVKDNISGKRWQLTKKGTLLDCSPAKA